ncbi:MAG: pyruvate kinase [Crenarchaeota archaeon]|nr:pyruvate kinase [Thermoproteota archaeon]
MFVKIIASIGPASSAPETVERMARAGANAFRLNFAHGNPEQWKQFVEAVREAEKKVGKPIALIGDLRGPSVRLGTLENPVEAKKGEIIVMKLANEAKGGDEKVVPVPVPHFFEVVDVGDLIVMDDGRVRLRVVDKPSPDEIEVVAVTDARITSRKAVVIRGKDYELPAISDYDLKCIEFAIENDFDYISLSYVRRAEDLEILKSILHKKGRPDIGVIAKIETRSAVENLDSIMDVADVVMVARGDLGMIFSLEDIHYYQTLIVSKCISRGKPVIVATQLLESMIENPVPTRAEVVDISTAVEQGVDALMLTGETSIGKHPVEAVTWLKKVIDHTEARMGDKLEAIARAARCRHFDLGYRFVRGVIELAEDLEAKFITFSMKGNTPRMMASIRPKMKLFVASNNWKALRKISILWGVHPFYVEAQSYDEGLAKAFSEAKRLGYVNIGDIAVLTYGLREEKQYVEILKVAEA